MPVPLRIYVDDEYLRPMGGISRGILEISRALRARGHEIHLAYRDEGSFLSDYRSFCSSTTSVPGLTMSKGSILRDGIRTARALGIMARVGTKRADVVYTNNLNDILYGQLLARRKGAVHVAHIRLPAVWSVLSKPIANRVHRYIAISEKTKTLAVASGLDPDRIDVVHTGLDLDRWPTTDDTGRRRAKVQLGIDPDSFTVAFVGRIVPEKGIDTLFAAFRLVVREIPDATLLVAGLEHPVTAESGQHHRELRRSTPPRCRWLGQREDVVSLYHAADVVVVPSRWEDPLPRSILEAMACGCVVVASRIGGNPEILTDALERLLFPVEDVTELASVLLQLGKDPLLRESLREASHGRVATGFSMDRMVSGIEGAFARALTHRG